MTTPTGSSHIMTFKCQCGRRVLHSSAMPVDCQGCELCSTSYARKGLNHLKLQDHVFTVKELAHKTNKVFFKCKGCGLVEKDSYLNAIK